MDRDVVQVDLRVALGSGEVEHDGIGVGEFLGHDERPMNEREAIRLIVRPSHGRDVGVVVRSVRVARLVPDLGLGVESRAAAGVGGRVGVAVPGRAVGVLELHHGRELVLETDAGGDAPSVDVEGQALVEAAPLVGNDGVGATNSSVGRDVDASVAVVPVGVIPDLQVSVLDELVALARLEGRLDECDAVLGGAAALGSRFRNLGGVLHEGRPVGRTALVEFGREAARARGERHVVVTERPAEGVGVLVGQAGRPVVVKVAGKVDGLAGVGVGDFDRDVLGLVGVHSVVEEAEAQALAVRGAPAIDVSAAALGEALHPGMVADDGGRTAVGARSAGVEAGIQIREQDIRHVHGLGAAQIRLERHGTVQVCHALELSGHVVVRHASVILEGDGTGIGAVR
mmetsp:Transcript_9871/g.18755  ORF Transcript_9871/g.18755 Transcript_9871/m.18755 type:complete len:399 (-) Transcript_9871:3603-4799(-)